MNRILHIITGDMSFDEMFLLDVFINQLPDSDSEHMILAPPLPMTHINLKSNISLEFAEADFDQSDWQTLLSSYQPDLILLGDPGILLYNEPGLTYFQPEWLDNLETPLAVLDYQGKLDQEQGGGVFLKKKPTTEGGRLLFPDYLIHTCPPQKAQQEPAIGHFYWRNMEIMPMLSTFSSRESTRQELGCEADTHIVTLLFPMEGVIMTGQKQLFLHVPAVVETLVYYLNKLDGKYQLYVINAGSVLEENQFDNVTVRFFTTLQMEMFERLLKISDLFLTESLSHPALIQAALHRIPPLVLVNSVQLKDGHLSMAFEQATSFVQLKLNHLMEEQPELLFPYTSFPFPSRQWPKELGIMYNEKFLFYLADLFDENQTGQLIGELLKTDSASKQEFLEVLEFYQENVNGSTDAEEIINTILEDN